MLIFIFKIWLFYFNQNYYIISHWTFNLILIFLFFVNICWTDHCNFDLLKLKFYLNVWFFFNIYWISHYHSICKTFNSHMCNLWFGLYMSPFYNPENFFEDSKFLNKNCTTYLLESPFLSVTKLRSKLTNLEKNRYAI